MFSYLQVPFLQALGYAIANSLWQVFLLWLLVIIVNGIARHSASIKYITAVTAQIGGFVWFVSTLQFYYQHCRAASLQAEQLLAQTGVFYTQTPFAGNSILSYLLKAEETLPFLSIAYLILMVLLLAKWLRACRFTKQLGSSGLQPVEAGWQRFVNETADRLEIVQQVTVYLSSLAKSPMTIGYIKPIILLPLASITQLTTEQMEAVLLHELAHIRRSDYLINLLVSIIEIVLFFNPFARLLSRQIREERENCCDDWVLQSEYNAAMYAEALLRIASQQNAAGLQMNAASPKGALLQRVKRLIKPEKTFNYKHQLAALVTITALLFSLAWLQPGNDPFLKDNRNNTVKEVNKKIIITPLTAQVDNPFFNGASLFSKSLQADVALSLKDIDKTFQDSITNITQSLRKAHAALQETLPQAITVVTSTGWQKGLNDARDEVAKSLSSISWQAFTDQAPLVQDSLFALNNAAEAYIDEASRINEAKRKTDAAAQLNRLSSSQLTFSFDKSYLQQLTTTALASLQDLNFKAFGDSVAHYTEVLNELSAKQKVQQDKFREKQKEWIRKAEDDYKKSAEAIRRSIPPIPPQPPVVNYVPDEKNDYNTDVYNNTLAALASSFYTQPVYQVNTNQNNGSKTIRIISDSTTLNIIIEIHQ